MLSSVLSGLLRGLPGCHRAQCRLPLPPTAGLQCSAAAAEIIANSHYAAAATAATAGQDGDRDSGEAEVAAPTTGECEWGARGAPACTEHGNHPHSDCDLHDDTPGGAVRRQPALSEGKGEARTAHPLHGCVKTSTSRDGQLVVLVLVVFHWFPRVEIGRGSRIRGIIVR